MPQAWYLFTVSGILASTGICSFMKRHICPLLCCHILQLERGVCQFIAKSPGCLLLSVQLQKGKTSSGNKPLGAILMALFSDCVSSSPPNPQGSPSRVQEFLTTSPTLHTRGAEIACLVFIVRLVPALLWAILNAAARLTEQSKINELVRSFCSKPHVVFSHRAG